MEQSLKPIKWDDLAVRHDPDSLPFWRFYQEAQMERPKPQRLRRAVGWLLGQRHLTR